MYKLILASVAAAVVAVCSPQPSALCRSTRSSCRPASPSSSTRPAFRTRARWCLETRARCSSAAAAPRTVYAIVDRIDDQKADQVCTIAQGLNDPSGVAFRDGSLYVAEISRITRYDDIEAKLDESARSRWSSTRICRPSRITARSSSRSDPTACSTCRSAGRAMSASAPTIRGSPRSCG